MWPVVYDFGIIQILGFEFHLAIYSYGLMLVVAFYTCYALLFKDMKRLNYDENIASDIVTAAAAGGIIGSKIYYLIENLDRVIIDPYGRAVMYFRPGVDPKLILKDLKVLI